MNVSPADLEIPDPPIMLDSTDSVIMSRQITLFEFAFEKAQIQISHLVYAIETANKDFQNIQTNE